MKKAQDTIIVTKEGVLTISHVSKSYELHIVDKIKNYSRLFWSTEACWKNLTAWIIKAYRNMYDAQDIIILTKDGILTNLTSLSPSNCISSINDITIADYFGQRRPADKSHGFQST